MHYDLFVQVLQPGMNEHEHVKSEHWFRLCSLEHPPFNINIWWSINPYEPARKDWLKVYSSLMRAIKYFL